MAWDETEYAADGVFIDAVPMMVSASKRTAASIDRAADEAFIDAIPMMVPAFKRTDASMNRADGLYLVEEALVNRRNDERMRGGMERRWLNAPKMWGL